MRLFIGLDLSKESKLALDDWRFKALPELSFSPRTLQKGHNCSRPKPVPVANFHITLTFLGSVNTRYLDDLVDNIDQICASPFSLTLNTTGFWPNPKIMFAAPQSPPDALMSLAKQTRKAARGSKIEVESRPYRPHVTLVRKASASMPPPLFMPDIECHFESFHLFESVSTPSGVSYPILNSWSLEPELSLRDQLKRGLIG